MLWNNDEQRRKRWKEKAKVLERKRRIAWNVAIEFRESLEQPRVARRLVDGKRDSLKSLSTIPARLFPRNFFEYNRSIHF